MNYRILAKLWLFCQGQGMESKRSSENSRHTRPTALELIQSFRIGERTATEIVAQSLSLAETDKFGAFAYLAKHYALAQAARLDELREMGAPLPPLAGLPLPIKDLTPVKGLPCRYGSKAMAGNIASGSDDLVQKLANLGSVMIGKTATPEFGLPCYTEPEIEAGPMARNPYDFSRGAGGSSGGAAVAVATGITPIAHGSDGGGSIRIPASCCGLVGHKASRGLLYQKYPKVPAMDLSVPGFLTNNVIDTGYIFELLRNPETSPELSLEKNGNSLVSGENQPLELVSRLQSRWLKILESRGSQLHVGLLLDPVITETKVHPAVVKVTEVVAARLAEFAHVEIISSPITPQEWAIFTDLWAVMAALVSVPEENKLRPLTRFLRNLRRGVSGIRYLQAELAMQNITRQVDQAWANFDVILSPTIATLPAKIGALRNDDDPAADFQAQCEFTPWGSIYNITGRPAISLPMGWCELSGVRLPIGVMLGAKVGDDDLLFALGNLLGC